MYIYSSESSPP